jgi:Tfp pilus assembly protein PilF
MAPGGHAEGHCRGQETSAVRGLASIALAFAVVLGGCQSGPLRNLQEDVKSIFGSTKGKPALAAGIRQYEEGKYADAAESLNSALYQGLSSGERVTAHKYLAFIHCISGRPAACREQFRRALAIDPNLELSAAEAGHPIWGPVFRAVKSGR